MASKKTACEKTQKIASDKVKVGDRVWFSGSTWTVAKIEDGKVYGTGGMTMLGYRAENPVHLFNVNYGGRPLTLSLVG